MEFATYHYDPYFVQQAHIDYLQDVMIKKEELPFEDTPFAPAGVQQPLSDPYPAHPYSAYAEAPPCAAAPDFLGLGAGEDAPLEFALPLEGSQQIEEYQKDMEMMMCVDKDIKEELVSEKASTVIADGQDEIASHGHIMYLVDNDEKEQFVSVVFQDALMQYFSIYADMKRCKKGRKPHYLKEQSAFCEHLLSVQAYTTTRTTYLGALARNLVSNVKRLGKNLCGCLLPRKKACIEEREIFFRVIKVVAPVLCKDRFGEDVHDEEAMNALHEELCEHILMMKSKQFTLEEINTVDKLVTYIKRQPLFSLFAWLFIQFHRSNYLLLAFEQEETRQRADELIMKALDTIENEHHFSERFNTAFGMSI